MGYKLSATQPWTTRHSQLSHGLQGTHNSDIGYKVLTTQPWGTKYLQLSRWVKGILIKKKNNIKILGIQKLKHLIY